MVLVEVVVEEAVVEVAIREMMVVNTPNHSNMLQSSNSKIMEVVRMVNITNPTKILTIKRENIMAMSMEITMMKSVKTKLNNNNLQVHNTMREKEDKRNKFFNPSKKTNPNTKLTEK